MSTLITSWLVMQFILGTIYMCCDEQYWVSIRKEGFKFKHLFWGCIFPWVLLCTILFVIGNWERLWNKRLFGGEK